MKIFRKTIRVEIITKKGEQILSTLFFTNAMNTVMHMNVLGIPCHRNHSGSSHDHRNILLERGLETDFPVQVVVAGTGGIVTPVLSRIVSYR